jgi:hypothetical protein
MSSQFIVKKKITRDLSPIIMLHKSRYNFKKNSSVILPSYMYSQVTGIYSFARELGLHCLNREIQAELEPVKKFQPGPVRLV